MAGGAPPPPLQLVERPEEEPLEEGAGLGLAIRVQCESLDCQALLEVIVPESVRQKAPPHLIVRCANCQRLLQVVLPASAYTGPPAPAGPQPAPQPDPLQPLPPPLPQLPEVNAVLDLQTPEPPQLQRRAALPPLGALQQQASAGATEMQAMQQAMQQLAQLAPPAGLPGPAPLSALMQQQQRQQQPRHMFAEGLDAPRHGSQPHAQWQDQALQAAAAESAAAAGGSPTHGRADGTPRRSGRLAVLAGSSDHAHEEGDEGPEWEGGAAGAAAGGAAGAAAGGAAPAAGGAGAKRKADEVADPDEELLEDDQQLFISLKFHDLKQERPSMGAQEALRLAKQAWNQAQACKRARTEAPAGGATPRDAEGSSSGAESPPPAPSEADHGEAMPASPPAVWGGTPGEAEGVPVPVRPLLLPPGPITVPLPALFRLQALGALSALQAAPAAGAAPAASVQPHVVTTGMPDAGH